MKSYGTGSVIKLPGAGPNQPNVYQFGTSYEEIYKDLTSKDHQLYPIGFTTTSIVVSRALGVGNGSMPQLAKTDSKTD